jgi:MFS family permease
MPHDSSPSVLLRPRLALGTCYAAMMVLAIAMNLMPVYLTSISADLGGSDGLSKEKLGLIGAATFVGLVSGILLSGPLADRLGAKAFTLAGSGLVAGGLGALSASHTYEQVLVAVSIMGLGSGILDMILSPIVSALQPERRAVAMNWLHSFYCVGAVATVLIATVALKLDVHWRTLALCMMVLPLGVAASFVRLRLPPLVEESSERLLTPGLLKERFFLVALCAIFLGGAAEMGMAQWLPAYAETDMGMSRWIGGMALVAFSIAMTLGRVVVGVLNNRVPIFTIMLWSCWSSVALFLIATASPWKWVALLASVLVGFTGSCLWPSTLAVTADRFPTGGASMFALLAAAGNLGGIGMPWAVGAIADRHTLALGLGSAALCPFLMAFLLLWMRRHAQSVRLSPLAPEPPKLVDPVP